MFFELTSATGALGGTEKIQASNLFGFGNFHVSRKIATFNL